MGGLSVQDLANMIWAFVKAAERRLSDFDAQAAQLDEALWAALASAAAFATTWSANVGHYGTRVCDGLRWSLAAAGLFPLFSPPPLPLLSFLHS